MKAAIPTVNCAIPQESFANAPKHPNKTEVGDAFFALQCDRLTFLPLPSFFTFPTPTTQSSRAKRDR
ncbi:hypothetical protein H6G33_36635 [Calothrix sp. FACHB-1219]|uniref:hypothetical protein n=1 Tax=unclassified Calothrix TaxID=2619626 RepID=UPI0016823268|nr:hypothetical protein [Calothrix sp. FACHB-168]MBD2207860.1 hypothetical protein [Calothrix sp. FACHB-168]MBD2222460.1 hypothetical protein [Calothrix sp. FACHB-1219]MBD2241350.1 hypothetical protein [Aulosira sp. FACHB-113]